LTGRPLENVNSSHLSSAGTLIPHVYSEYVPIPSAYEVMSPIPGKQFAENKQSGSLLRGKFVPRRKESGFVSLQGRSSGVQNQLQGEVSQGLGSQYKMKMLKIKHSRPSLILGKDVALDRMLSLATKALVGKKII